jgi:hypothetical protein
MRHGHQGLGDKASQLARGPAAAATPAVDEEPTSPITMRICAELTVRVANSPECDRYVQVSWTQH